jgi:hypothetical protein
VVAERYLCAAAGEFYGDSSADVPATAEDDSKFVLKVGHIVLFSF